MSGPFELYRRVRRFFAEGLWGREALWARVLQACTVTVENTERDQIFLRAHSLTYISLLSLIPLLALAVSMVQLVGMRDELLGLVLKQMSTVVPQAAEFIQQRVSKLNFASLGTVGGPLLVLTTILAVGNVERSFNQIWGVTRQRSWLRRFTDYLAVIVIAPLVLGVAISLGTTLQSQSAVRWLLGLPGFSAAYDSGLKQLPTLLMSGGLAFVYWFLPNTDVRPLSAAVGGLLAGVLFSAVQAAYVGLNVGAARYNALFGGFAAVPLFIVWVYFSWVVVLVGAEMACAHQHLARHRREARSHEPTPAAREAVGLGAALEVASRFEQGGACTAEELADALGAPVRTLGEILGRFEEAGIVARRTDERRADAFQLGRPAERVRVADVLRSLRGERRAVTPGVDRVFEELEKREQEVAERDTLADLLERCVST